MSDAPVTILFVDDDDVFRERLARAFADRGHRVLTAASGPEALDRFDPATVTHAVIDLRMPHMSGLDVVRALHQKAPGLWMVVLTGFGTIDTAVEAVHAGARHYLQKPTTAAQVEAALFGAGAVAPDAPGDDDIPSLARHEWDYIQRVLAECDGNITHAAERLGLHRRTLQRKLQKYPPKK